MYIAGLWDKVKTNYFYHHGYNLVVVTDTRVINEKIMTNECRRNKISRYMLVLVSRHTNYVYCN